MVNDNATSVYGCKIIPSALNIDKNCLISLVKSDDFEHFVGQSAKIYYTEKKFPTTVALNRLLGCPVCRSKKRTGLSLSEMVI